MHNLMLFVVLLLVNLSHGSPKKINVRRLKQIRKISLITNSEIDHFDERSDGHYKSSGSVIKHNSSYDPLKRPQHGASFDSEKRDHSEDSNYPQKRAKYEASYDHQKRSQYGASYDSENRDHYGVSYNPEKPYNSEDSYPKKRDHYGGSYHPEKRDNSEDSYDPEKRDHYGDSYFLKQSLPSVGNSLPDEDVFDKNVKHWMVYKDENGVTQRHPASDCEPRRTGGIRSGQGTGVRRPRFIKKNGKNWLVYKDENEITHELLIIDEEEIGVPEKEITEEIIASVLKESTKKKTFKENGRNGTVHEYVYEGEIIPKTLLSISSGIKEQVKNKSPRTKIIVKKRLIKLPIFDSPRRNTRRGPSQQSVKKRVKRQIMFKNIENSSLVDADVKEASRRRIVGDGEEHIKNFIKEGGKNQKSIKVNRDGDKQTGKVNRNEGCGISKLRVDGENAGCALEDSVVEKAPSGK